MEEKTNTQPTAEEKTQEPIPSSMTAIAAGLIIAVIGSIIGSNWDKDTMVNIVGFGMLLTGIAVFVLGLFGTATKTLKTYLDQKGAPAGIKVAKPKALFSSIWAIGVGTVLSVIGYIVSSSYAKESLMNYAGFGMQLAGIAVFVLGAFETARASANIYLSSRPCADNTPGARANINLSKRAKNFWHNLKSTHMLYNIAGIMLSMSLLFFGLWQLDLIVSGPVWWSANGQGWSHPNGAYADDYFQCFVWKTTVGQAYDTLFMLIFISFIVLFVSVFLWPRKRVV